MNNNTRPLVSVIISTYNRPQLLERAINSVINQDYNNIEVIISDDCSSYDIDSLIEKIKKISKFPIYLIRNSSNKGACYTRNKGIHFSNGSFIAGLDDDDEFTSNRISLLMNNYDPKYSLVTSNTLVVSKNRTFALFSSRKNKVINIYDMLWENVIGTQCLVEKARIIALEGFDVNLSSAQDADMWLRLVEGYGPALRVKESTYLLHTEHDNPRISSSKNKINGLINYTNKHKHHMNSGQLAYSKFKILLWSNKKIQAICSLNLHSFLYIIKKLFLKIIK
ncbi:glycosyltransferase [Providencia huaxiensis]|uniref:glycosyltransferase n=1 Tax=Providencia huaxiensis TaxID=2027290 RepID=UPI0034E53E49